MTAQQEKVVKLLDSAMEYIMVFETWTQWSYAKGLVKMAETAELLPHDKLQEYKEELLNYEIEDSLK